MDKNDFYQKAILLFSRNRRLEINCSTELFKIALESTLHPRLSIIVSYQNKDVIHYDIKRYDYKVCDLTLTRTPNGKSLLGITPDYIVEKSIINNYQIAMSTSLLEDMSQKMEIIGFISDVIQWAEAHRNWDMEHVKKESENEEPNQADSSLKPWEKIPDYRWDRKAIELWCNGEMNKFIAIRVGVSNPRTVTNRISYLRNKYPKAKIPNDEERNRPPYKKS